MMFKNGGLMATLFMSQHNLILMTLMFVVEVYFYISMLETFIIKFIFLQSLVIPEKFQHILRIMGTNIDGKRKVTIAMTAIKGCGRRYANIVLKKADVDLTKRAGECTDEEVSISFFDAKYFRSTVPK